MKKAKHSQRSGVVETHTPLRINQIIQGPQKPTKPKM